MTDETNYKVGIVIKYPWHMGYNPEKDLLFLVRFTEDDMAEFITHGHPMNTMLAESVDWDRLEMLGEL